MVDFNLRALIVDALGSSEPDPHVIARRLLPRIPAGERDAILGSLLVERVTQVMRSARSASEFAVDHPTSGRHTTLVDGKPCGSSRWAAHMATIRQRYSVGPRASDWKLYEDLTAEDCEYVASEYEQRAEANAALARRFRQLAAELRTVGASCLADLQERVA